MNGVVVVAVEWKRDAKNKSQEREKDAYDWMYKLAFSLEDEARVKGGEGVYL